MLKLRHGISSSPPATAGPPLDTGELKCRRSKVVQLHVGPKEKNVPPWVQMQSPDMKGNGSWRTQKIYSVTSPAGGDGEGVAHGCEGASLNSSASVQLTERLTLGCPRLVLNSRFTGRASTWAGRGQSLTSCPINCTTRL